jgi:staphylococcal nuclease domain-containing protein 1
VWLLLICFIYISSQVVDVVSGDCIVVADDAAPYGSPSAERRVNLSSIRAPKLGNPRRDEKPQKFAREAKEFLRTRLIDKQVRDNRVKLSSDKKLPQFLKIDCYFSNFQVTVEMEYSRRISTMDGQNVAPTTSSSDTRVLDYGSVFFGTPSKADGEDLSSGPSSGSQAGVNIAELLLSRGFAQTSKHRDYEERSHYYDALLAAESRAEKAKKGLHSGKDTPVMHITDLTTVRNPHLLW